MKTVRFISTTIVAVALMSATTFAEPAGLERTALDRYVAAPDSNYKYEVTNTIDGDGFTTYIVDMTSQKWLTEKEVNLPIWEHVMTITKPDMVTSDTGFLYITGGDKKKPTRDAAPGRDIQMAKETGTVITTL